MSNLKAEMARKNIGIKELALLINKDERTVKNKINGITPLLYSEAVKIRKNYFPDYELDYLFEQVEEK